MKKENNLPKQKRGTVDKSHPDAVAAKSRVLSMIDAVPPEDLVASIKRAPSLRGMILGYIAEEMFENYLVEKYSMLQENIEKHDDHNRQVNKSDRTVKHNGRLYGIQLKSVQTNSIGMNLITKALQADVQNDASDARTIKLPDGSTVLTTCYQRGEYDILAVPLFPFTGKWEYAYKRNLDCRSSTSKKYSESQAEFLLSSTEKITWPLSDAWTMNLLEIMDGKIGRVLATS
jgi:hypothetical protein